MLCFLGRVLYAGIQLNFGLCDPLSTSGAQVLESVLVKN